MNYTENLKGIKSGIQVADAFASDYGDNLMTLLSTLEEKLRHQLEKR